MSKSNDALDSVSQIRPGDEAIAFALACDDRKNPNKLVEIWVFDGTQWKAGGLNVKSRQTPERLVGLFAAAELGRRRRPPKRTFLERSTNTTLWGWARKLINICKPAYVAQLDCFQDSFRTHDSAADRRHPFLNKWFIAQDKGIELHSDHLRGGRILFYRLPKRDAVAELATKLGATSVQDWQITGTHDLENLVKTFSIPTRCPMGAALKNTKRPPRVTRKSKQKVLPSQFGGRVQEFRSQYLIQDNRPGLFGDREHDLAELNQWLDAPQVNPYRLICSPAGFGKSTLLVHWTEHLVRNRRDVALVYVPISARYDTNLRGYVFQHLATQLAALHGEEVAIGVIFEDIVIDYLNRQPPKKTLLVVLDGLDEAADWQPGLQMFPATPPPGLKIVVSAREMANCTPSDWLGELGWDRPGIGDIKVLSPLTLEGVIEITRRASDIPPSEDVLINAASELLRLSCGSPLIVSLYLDDLRIKGVQLSSFLLSELRSVPPGLDGYFERWLKDQRQLWRNQPVLLERPVSAMFDLLSCALGPIRESDMLALLHVDGVTNSHALREALGRIQRFVVGDENRGYAFAHPLFAEHFRSRLPEAEVRVIEERFLDYGKHTLAGLNDGSIKPETASKYIVSYYGAHLERMHCGIAELAELTSRSWSLASEIVDDSGVGYLADIERVLGAAHEANLRAGATNGVVLPFIGTVMRCFFIRSRCFVFRKNVPDDLLSLLVESHIWPINRALAYAYQHDDPFVRARRVIAILHGTATEAPSIKNHIVHTAVTELRKIDPSYTTLLLDSVPGMLALLAGELVDSQSALHLLSTAVTLADKLPSGGIDKSKAYLQLARQYARRGEYRLALQVAQREKNDNLALAAIVEEMAELRLVDKALIIAEGISCGQERGRAMLAIAKVLPKCKRKQTLIDQALHEIRKIASDEDRALLLGTAFGMLSDETNTTGLLKEALRGLKRTSELRLEILIEVLKNSTIESTQAQVLGEIIRLVRTSPNFYNQWVPYIVREMGRMKRFTEAQEFARSMPRSAEYLVQALTALAQTMPSDEMKRLVVMEALHNCRESVRHRYGQSWKIEEGQPVCINEIFSNADVDDECFDEKWCPVSNWVDAMLDTTNRCRRREVVIEARQLAEAFMDSDEPRDLFTIIGVISGNESLRELMQKVHVRGSDVVCCRVVQAFIAHPDDVREVMAVLFGASLLLVEKSNEIYDKVLYPRSKEPRQSATQQLYRLFAAVLARLSSNGRGRNTFEISDLMHTIGYLGKRQAINETADSFSEIENW